MQGPTFFPAVLARGRALAASALIALLAAACSSGGGETGGLGLPAAASLAPSGAIPYQPGNAFSPAGYSESLLGENRYRIKVMGYPGSSPSHMEKIAHTRAAEIGKDMHLRYFKVENVQHSTSCTPARSTPKGGGHPDLNYRVLTADVTYSKSREPEPGYLESRGTFKQLRAELDRPEASATPVDEPPFQCPTG